MIKYRPANSRGIIKNSWIVSRRTFSNNSYWDPKYMNFGPLKVINDDILQPGYMVPNHQHKNYDILGYLVEGELEHSDSNNNIVRASSPQIQHMSCGINGIWHTEKCISNIPARYLQIWITTIPELRENNSTYNIINRDINFNDLNINVKQHIRIRCGILNDNITLHDTNNSYLYVVSGNIKLNDTILNEGDGAVLVYNHYEVESNSHIILFNI